MKKIINCLLIVLSVTLYVSCTPQEDDLFGDSSANRIDAALKANNDILIGATNGWLMEYYPSKTQQYGGYNMLVKFSDDGMVTVASDVFEPSEKVTSTYSLLQSGGAVLSFDTYNEIMHFFSDPKNPSGVGTNGKGMEGDFEFVIMESSKEKMVLQGRKTRNIIVMTPLDAAIEWEDYLGTLTKADSKMAVGNARFICGDVEGLVSFSFRRMAITYANDGVQTTVNVPFIVTEKGYKFYEPLHLGGVIVNELTYAKLDEVLFTSPDGKVKILSLPLTTQLVAGTWYCAYSALGDYGKSCWNEAKLGLDAEKEQLYYAYLDKGHFVFGCSPVGTTTLYKGIVGFGNKLNSGNEIQFSASGVNDSNGSFYVNNVPKFKKFFEPLIGTFTLTSDDPANATWIKLQDTLRPTNVITLQKNPVYWPLSK